MAGHNKWSKIKHRKAVVDKRRAKAWTMCSRAIIVAAKTGGPDPSFNFALRAAIDEARYHNVPADNIDRAIKKGVGGGAGDDYEPVRYEGYGPAGAAIVIDALTNNRARTAGDVRLILGDHSGKLGTSGCVAHQFEAKGRIVVSATRVAPDATEDRVLEAALNAGADDVKSIEPEEPAVAGWEVLCPPAALHAVKQGLIAAGFGSGQPEVASAGRHGAPVTPSLMIGECTLEMIPTVTVAVSGAAAKELLELIDALEDNDDIKKVHTNADIPESELAAME